MRDSHPFFPGSKGESISVVKRCVRKAEQFSLSQQYGTVIITQRVKAVLPSKEHATQPLLAGCQNCSWLHSSAAAKSIKTFNLHYPALLQHRAAKGKGEWVRLFWGFWGKFVVSLRVLYFWFRAPK